MKDLSLNVLDIVQNSVTAGARKITVSLADLAGKDLLTISVEDDGCGMQEDFLKKVTDPFITTRTTRNVGMGIPLFKMAAEMAGGTFDLRSAPGEGTTVRASFRRSHIDRPPVGNMAETIVTIVQGNPEIRLIYIKSTDRDSFVFDSEEIAEALGGVPLDTPEVLAWIREYIEENENELNVQNMEMEL